MHLLKAPSGAFFYIAWLIHFTAAPQPFNPFAQLLLGCVHPLFSYVQHQQLFIKPHFLDLICCPRINLNALKIECECFRLLQSKKAKALRFSSSLRNQAQSAADDIKKQAIPL